MIITKIEIQKNNKRRYNLYCGDSYLFSVMEDTLLHFSIAKDKNYSDQKLAEIQQYDQLMQCIDQAYRFLSRRPHLEAELKRKLRQKNYPESIIQQVLQRLGKNKYLDDSDYIRRLILEEIQKKNGPLLIKKKLLEKGAAPEEINEKMKLFYTPKLIAQNAGALAAKKEKGLDCSDSRRFKQKIGAFLQQKGYDWETINRVVKVPESDDAV